MISDVLCEAVKDIDWYLTELPDVYDVEIRREIENVRLHMLRLQAKLDDSLRYLPPNWN